MALDKPSPLHYVGHMFNIGGGEMVMIALIALLFIKPEKLPGFATRLGRFMAQIRNQVNDVKKEIESGYNDQSNDKK